ncbi:acetyltransferase [Marinobacter sp.]|uniref:acetyltransferase n=1 Tax=Marinobacter sp. TaxID=50741 RepID=UPI003A8CB12C
MTLTFQRINKKQHNRQGFDCGLELVNKFLKESARKHMDAGVSQTWVAILEPAATADSLTPIAGYFTLTQSVVKREDLPAGVSAKKFPAYPLPVIKIAWLGVDQQHQGSGARLGESLLLEALDRAYKIVTYSDVGVAVVVDPLTPESDQFFQKYGFEPMALEFRSRHSLNLPMGTVKALVES